MSGAGAGAATYKYLDKLFDRLMQPETADLANQYLQAMTTANFVDVGKITEKDFSILLSKVNSALELDITHKQAIQALRLQLINARINGLRAANKDSGVLQELYQTEFDFTRDLLIILKDLSKITPETHKITALKEAIADYLKTSFALQPGLLNVTELSEALDQGFSDEYLLSLKMRVGTEIVRDPRSWMDAQNVYLDKKRAILESSAKAIAAMYDVGELMESYPTLQGNLIKIVQRSAKYGLLFSEMRKSKSPKVIVLTSIFKSLETAAKLLNQKIGKVEEMEQMMRARKASFASTASGEATEPKTTKSKRPSFIEMLNQGAASLRKKASQASPSVPVKTSSTAKKVSTLFRKPSAEAELNEMLKSNLAAHKRSASSDTYQPSASRTSSPTPPSEAKPAAPATKSLPPVLPSSKPPSGSAPKPPPRPIIKLAYTYQGFELEKHIDHSKRKEDPDREVLYYKKPDGSKLRVYQGDDGNLIYNDPTGEAKRLDEIYPRQKPRG